MMIRDIEEFRNRRRMHREGDRRTELLEAAIHRVCIGMLIHALLQLSKSPDPTDELDTLIGTRIPDPQQRSENRILQKRYIQCLDRIDRPRRQQFRACTKQEPLTAEVHADLALHLRRNRLCQMEHLIILLDGEHEILRIHPMKILDDTVVVHDLQLLIREQHRQEVVKLLRAIIVRMRLPTSETDLDRARCAMMAIRDIGRRHLLEKCLQRRYPLAVCDSPYPMSDAIIRHERIERRFLLYLLHDRLDTGMCTIGEEDRARLRRAGIHMADTILLLLFHRVLMLLTDPVQIIIDRAERDDTGLCPSLHRQLIDVVACARFTHEGPICDLCLQHIRRLLVHLRRIHILRLRELGFRSVNV